MAIARTNLPAFIALLLLGLGLPTKSPLAQPAYEALMDAACREEIGRVTDPSQKFLKAAECGNVAFVRQSLDSGVPITASEPRFGKTAIHIAAERGKTDVVDLLLKRGAEPDTVIASYTPLIHAAVGGYVKVVSLLLDRGADPNRDYIYGTPLTAAVNHGRADVVQALIRGGANVNQRARYRGGETALHTVSRREYWRSTDAALIEILFSAGADPSIADARGLNAIQAANPEAKKVLEQLMAKK